MRESQAGSDCCIRLKNYFCWIKSGTHWQHAPINAVLSQSTVLENIFNSTVNQWKARKCKIQCWTSSHKYPLACVLAGSLLKRTARLVLNRPLVKSCLRSCPPPSFCWIICLCLPFGPMCTCVLIVLSTHQCCSALLSILGHTHTFPPCRLHSCCTTGGKTSAHTEFRSSLPHTDTHRCSIYHGYHSPPHIPLLKK